VSIPKKIAKIKIYKNRQNQIYKTHIHNEVPNPQHVRLAASAVLVTARRPDVQILNVIGRLCIRRAGKEKWELIGKQPVGREGKRTGCTGRRLQDVYEYTVRWAGEGTAHKSDRTSHS
jgi:hypothetical protein